MDYFEKKKKRREDDFGIGFDRDFMAMDFDRFAKDMQSMMDQMTKGFASDGDLFKTARTRPIRMGFSIKLGQNGTPVIREFGNVKRSQGKPVISNKREPLVDVQYLDKEIVITAELPGVMKEELQVSAKKGSVTIDVKSAERPYFKEIAIQEPFSARSLSTKLKNGILEITVTSSHA